MYIVHIEREGEGERERERESASITLYTNGLFSNHLRASSDPCRGAGFKRVCRSKFFEKWSVSGNTLGAPNLQVSMAAAFLGAFVAAWSVQ